MTKGWWLSHSFAALIALIFAAPLAWLLLDRDPPIVVARAAMMTEGVQAGGDLRVSYLVNRRRTCSTIVYPILYDGENIRHVFEPEALPDPGDIGREVFTVRRRVPSGAEPGEARYRVTLQWRCPFNLFHHIWPVTMVLPEVPFTILPATEKETS